MAGLTLDEFEREIYSTAIGWKWGRTPTTLRLTLTSIKIRIYVDQDRYIDCFFNEVTGRTSFTLIESGGLVKSPLLLSFRA